MNASPANQYLDLIRSSIDAIKRDVPTFTQLGEKMATSLLKGGGLFTPQIGTYWPSEFGGRAGGLMGLKPAGYVARSENDVAFTTLPDARRWKPADDERWRKLTESKAQIFVVGSPEEARAAGVAVDRVAGFTGGATAERGLYGTDDLRPLAPVRPFEQLVRGWLTCGEMVAACTRLSSGAKMPVLWMSVWLEGALPRNASFFKHDNVREPWYPPLFHDSIYIPPMGAGYVAREFLDVLEGIHSHLLKQADGLHRAGQWMAEAVRAGKRVSTVLVGHSYPEILELAEPKSYPLAWLPSISDLRKAHHEDLGAGDVALHLGYAPVDVGDVRRILDRGVRFIYTSPYGRPAALEDHPNLLWLDLPWRPGDATVDIPGYSVRLLPMSSSAHTMVYFALVCELAERMGWK
jgi:hypothetical protein